MGARLCRTLPPPRESSGAVGIPTDAEEAGALAVVAVAARGHVLTQTLTVVQTETKWVNYAMTTTTGTQLYPDL